jgi:hypothetical protein
MSQSKGAAEVEKSLLAGLLEALSDKHAQLDINLQGISIKSPRTGLTVELNGVVTVTCHIREMTESEKKASAARNVALMSKG